MAARRPGSSAGTAAQTRRRRQARISPGTRAATTKRRGGRPGDGPAAAAVATFSNGTAIANSAAANCGSGPANPYPSTIEVAGTGPVVTDVDVYLFGFSHTEPREVDVLLVGPKGQNVLVVSDVGSEIDAVNVTFSLNDESGRSLPSDGALASGTYTPTNHQGFPDTFAPPAPGSNGSSALSAFDGTNPTGTWRLYVIDQGCGDAGGFSGGWGLDVTTSAPPVAGDDRLTVKAGNSVRRSLLANDRDPDGTPLTARRVTKPRHGTALLTAGGTLRYAADRDYTGRDSFIYEVRDATGLTARATVIVKIEG